MRNLMRNIMRNLMRNIMRNLMRNIMRNLMRNEGRLAHEGRLTQRRSRSEGGSLATPLRFIMSDLPTYLPPYLPPYLAPSLPQKGSLIFLKLCTLKVLDK